jgi:hypothetical protein
MDGPLAVGSAKRETAPCISQRTGQEGPSVCERASGNHRPARLSALDWRGADASLAQVLALVEDLLRLVSPRGWRRERRSALPDAREATGRTLHPSLAPMIATPLLDEAGAEPVPDRYCGQRGDRNDENADGGRLHRVGERGQVNH